MSEETRQAGVVRDASRETHEEVTFEVTSNGTRKDAGPQFNPAVMGGRPVSQAEFDATKTTPLQQLTEEDMMKFFGELAKRGGLEKEAAKLLGLEFKTTMMAKAGRVMNTRVQVKHVVYAAAALGGIYLVWEGIAYFFDLPRHGLFGQRSPSTTAERPATRRISQ